MPGLREELVTELIRSLPKHLRVNFVPAPNRAREFLAATPPGEEPILDALERYFRSTTGVVVPREAWDWSRVPAHLQPTFRVVGDDGAEAARGKDLESLKEPLRPSLAQAIADVAADSGVSATRPDARGRSAPSRSPSCSAGRATRCGATPRSSTRGRPSGLQVVGSAEEAAARHRLGVRRLLLLALGPTPSVDRLGLDQRAKLALVGSPYPSIGDLVEDLRAAIVGDLVDARPVGA